MAYRITVNLRIQARSQKKIRISNIRRGPNLIALSGGSWVGQIWPWLSIEVGNGVWPPLGSRKSNDSIVILSKCKDFGPPYRCRLRIWPPRRNSTLKGHQKFWEIDEILWGNAEILF